MQKCCTIQIQFTPKVEHLDYRTFLEIEQFNTRIGNGELLSIVTNISQR